jgi:hypothetical protein
VTRSITVYFDHDHTSGVHVAAPEELSKSEKAGAEKVIACALGMKDPTVNRGRVTLFLLDAGEARTLGEKLLQFASEQKAS